MVDIIVGQNQLRKAPRAVIIWVTWVLPGPAIRAWDLDLVFSLPWLHFFLCKMMLRDQVAPKVP